MLLARPPPDDPGLVDACGDDPGAICEAVWDGTSNEALAKLADWVIGRPLTIILILLVAWLVARLARRLVRRAVYRVDRRRPRRGDTGAADASASASPVGDRRRPAARGPGVVDLGGRRVDGHGRSIWVIALLLVLGELGINLAPLIAGAGIAGVALGFGAQNLVKDCVSGLFMLIEDQYGIGDVVDLGVATGVGRADHAAHDRAARPGRHGVARPERRDPARRQPLASCGRSPSSTSSSPTTPTSTRRAQVRRTTSPQAVCESSEFAGDVLAAPELLGVESVSADGVTLRLLVKTAPAPSSGCSGRCARRSSSASTAPASRSCRRRRAGTPRAASDGR